MMTDDKMPEPAINAIKQHNTMACASADGVYVSESQIVEQIMPHYPNFDYDAWMHGEGTYYELRNICANIIMHEYGHILHGHVFMKSPTDKADARALVFANEIETNRGVVSDNHFGLSEWFNKTSVTDDKDPFTPTKPLITHTAVYKTVKGILAAQQKDQDEDSGNGGDDEKDAGEDDENENNGNGGNQNYQEPKNDILPSDKESNNFDNQTDALDKLCDELGLSPSADLSDEGKTSEERLEIIGKKLKSRTIQKSLERIKGHLKGEICRTKVGTYSRPSRKDGSDGLMRRGTKRGKDTAPKILIALDSSGSMDSVSVKNATTAIKSLLDTIGRNRTDAHICTFDGYIRQVDSARNWESVVSRYYPDGGTNFSCVMDKAIELGCDVILCVGDGEAYLDQRGFKEKNQGLDKYPHWVDVLITNNPNGDEYIKRNYGVPDLPLTRETLWLGNDCGLIKKLLGDYT